MRALSDLLREATEAAPEADGSEGEGLPQGDEGGPEKGGESPRRAGSDERGRERVPLAMGQEVEVRTVGGDLVVSGVIYELNGETGSVRVVDASSGTDHQVYVDPDLYEVWVKPQDIPGKAGAGEPDLAPSINPHKRGVYQGGRFKF